MRGNISNWLFGLSLAAWFAVYGVYFPYERFKHSPSAGSSGIQSTYTDKEEAHAASDEVNLADLRRYVQIAVHLRACQNERTLTGRFSAECAGFIEVQAAAMEAEKRSLQ